MKHVVLYSGGLDSFITAEYVRREKLKSYQRLELVYVPMGHRYEGFEKASAKRLPLEVSFLPGLENFGLYYEEKDAYIWQRNAFLCLLAAKRLEGEDWGKIWLTVQKDEISLPDRSPHFFKVMTELLFALGVKADVDTPWWSYDKTDMVSWYLNLAGGSAEKLKETHSCYRPGVLQCGNCSACVRRFIAMSLNGIKEEYEIDPRYSDAGKEYLKRALNEYYSTERNRKTRLALEVKDATE